MIAPDHNIIGNAFDMSRTDRPHLPLQVNKMMIQQSTTLSLTMIRYVEVSDAVGNRLHTDCVMAEAPDGSEVSSLR